MPVDRPDPADDPDEQRHRRPPDDPRPIGAAPLPLDSALSDAVHRASRAQVGRIYAAHQENPRDDALAAAADDDADRDRWAEALPSLRGAWEEHQNRYPERERVTPVAHMDGSWSSGLSRRLTPDQNTEATNACADIQDGGERVALPAMLQIEAADPNRSLVGLEHGLKAEDRLKETGFG